MSAITNDPEAEDFARGAKASCQLLTRVIADARARLLQIRAADPATLAADPADTIGATRLTVSQLLALRSLYEQIVGLAEAGDSALGVMVTRIGNHR